MHKKGEKNPVTGKVEPPSVYTGYNPQPTDPSSSAFVQENEWVIPLIENRDGTVVPAEDYEPAKVG